MPSVTCLHGVKPKKNCKQCNPPKGTKHAHICAWCRETFTNRTPKSTFCTIECAIQFYKTKSRLLTYYTNLGYSQERVAQEVSKLYKLGKDYKITE